MQNLALWCSEEYITTANYRLQQALQVIESWAQSWLVKMNKMKTTFTIFSLFNQNHSVHLKLKVIHYTRKTHLHVSASPWTEDLPGKTSSRRTRLERRFG